MKSTMKQTTEVTLIMNAREANWLRSIMQNPIAQKHDRELPEDAEMRKHFWNQLVKHT